MLTALAIAAMTAPAPSEAAPTSIAPKARGPTFAPLAPCDARFLPTCEQAKGFGLCDSANAACDEECVGEVKMACPVTCSLPAEATSGHLDLDAAPSDYGVHLPPAATAAICSTCAAQPDLPCCHDHPHEGNGRRLEAHACTHLDPSLEDKDRLQKINEQLCEEALELALIPPTAGFHRPRVSCPKADLKGAKLQEADLQKADLQDAKLQDADLQKAKLQGANLLGAHLEYANLESADLERADLSGAKLEYAHLRYANLRYANLRYADLRGANLQNVDLRYANLYRADLRGYLYDAQLQGADLRYAKLQGAVYQGANFTNATGVDPYWCNAAICSCSVLPSSLRCHNESR